MPSQILRAPHRLSQMPSQIILDRWISIIPRVGHHGIAIRCHYNILIVSTTAATVAAPTIDVAMTAAEAAAAFTDTGTDGNTSRIVSLSVCEFVREGRCMRGGSGWVSSKSTERKGQ